MELVARLLILIIVIFTILLVIIAVELGYMIYHKNANEDSLESIFRNSHNKHHHDREFFNPERNYPKPATSVFKDEPVELHYAAGSTEIPNDMTQIRDDYYAKNLKPY